MASPAGEGPSLPLSPWQTGLMIDRQPKLSKHSARLTSQNLDSHPRARDCFYIQVTDGKPRFEERGKLAQCFAERVSKPGLPPGLSHLRPPSSWSRQATAAAPDTPGASVLETLLLPSLTHKGSPAQICPNPTEKVQTSAVHLPSIQGPFSHGGSPIFLQEILGQPLSYPGSMWSGQGWHAPASNAGSRGRHMS